MMEMVLDVDDIVNEMKTYPCTILQILNLQGRGRYIDTVLAFYAFMNREVTF
jgi:hypothetical protein